MTRAFVAVRPPDDVLDALERELAFPRTLMTGVRWSPREQWHLTLRFLGNAPDPDAVIAAVPVLAAEPRRIQLGVAGSFPLRARRAQVLWMGVELGAKLLHDARTDLDQRLEPLGFAREEQPFRPHLTLGRAQRRPVDPKPFVSALPELVGEPWLVDHVTLYESRLSAAGAEHIARATIPLEHP